MVHREVRHWSYVLNTISSGSHLVEVCSVDSEDLQLEVPKNPTMKARQLISLGYGVGSTIALLLIRPLWQPYVFIAGFVSLMAVWLVVYHNWRISRFELRTAIPLHVGTFMIPFMPLATGALSFSWPAGILVYGVIVAALGVVSIPMIVKDRKFGLLATSGLLIALGILLVVLARLFGFRVT